MASKLVKQCDELTRQILWVKELGRCFVCGLPAHEVAHIYGRREHATRWDTRHDGNCHLLCKPCHNEDHRGVARPYRDKFLEMFGAAAMILVLQRHGDGTCRGFVRQRHAELVEEARTLGVSVEDLILKSPADCWMR